MDGQKVNTSGGYDGDGGDAPSVHSATPVLVNLGTDALDSNALSLDAPSQSTQDLARPVQRRSGWLRPSNLIIVAIFALGVLGLVMAFTGKKPEGPATSNVGSQYDTQHVSLSGVSPAQQGEDFGSRSVVINGPLRLNQGLVIAPSLQPGSPVGGQLYYDQNTNVLAYFNGSEFVKLEANSAVQLPASVGVASIDGTTGPFTVGSGIGVVGNQLLNSGVLSVGGQTGAISVGSGLSLTGNTLQNSGVISLVSGSVGLNVVDDGAGNLTISTSGAGSGTVTSGGGTAGRIAKFTGVQNVEDSLLSEAGAVITVNGDLTVTGTTTLSNPLSVPNGGTGQTSLAANGVLIGTGAGPVNSVATGAAGLCFVSTLGAPGWAACTNSVNAVTSLNGLTGALTIANATGLVNTITIDDASTSNKGIAQFNGTNFSVVGGTVNTVQNIDTTASPNFSSITLSGDANVNGGDITSIGNLRITPSGSLTAGSTGQGLSLQGDATTTLRANDSGNTTTLSFQTPTANVTYRLLTGTAGSYDICTSAGNCGIGSSVTTSGGTTDRLSKFSGAQSIADSSVSDDGSLVTVLGTVNLLVQGGTGTFGTLTQAGSVVLNDGSSNTATISLSGLAANRNYTLPDAGGDATFCLSTGNCAGSGAPADAAYLVATLNGTLTDERVLTGGTNISVTDGGAGGNMTVATISNPTFATSVTTPALQSSGALTITSGAGDSITINAGTTIELQDSVNVTGNLDISGSLTAGAGDAFVVNSSGAITGAAGITSAGTITFSALNCTSNLNGGALTTNGSGQLICSDDDGGAGSAISGSGTVGTIPLFNGTQTITDSIITQSGSTVTIAGDLALTTDLTVANGGTGVSSFTSNGVLYGNGAGAIQVSAAGTGGQVLVANGSGVPTFMSFTGDISVDNTGVTAIQPNSVALGTDTTGSFVSNLGSLTGLSTTGNSGEGSTPTLSVNYGAIANTAVQGNVTLTCPSGTGNLTGTGNAITLGSGGSCNGIGIVNNPSFSTSVTSPNFILTGAGNNGSIVVGNLGQGTVYTLPDPGQAAVDICLSTGNCATAGSAGGDLTGTYPNPTIAKLQNTNLSISAPSAGHVLIYNGTNGAWENHTITSDVVIAETGVATIQANAVALGTDTTGNYVVGLTAGNGVSVTGSAGEGWSPTVAVLYGSSANTAVEGNTSISVSAGTNLTGGGSITLGAGGSVTLNVASSPTFSGNLTVQGGTATVGAAAQQGVLVLHDGSGETGSLQVATLGQPTTFTLPDPGTGSVTVCVSTGNCAGAGGGVTTTGGTTNRLSKFTASQAIGDSSVSDNGTTVTILGTANLTVQGGTSTFGTLTQAGSLVISDGSSNTVTILSDPLSADRIYTLPDVGGDATLCVNTGNCLGGTGGAPNAANYLVSSLDATLTNERALAGGTNISLTDGGANGNMTVATVNNPTFSTSVTTPALQSSGALVISSGATTVAIDATTTIELQDSTNVTGSLDVSVALNVGTGNAFAVNSSGAITAAAGVTSSGTITFSGLNCTGNANGGALTTNGSGQLICSDDDGGAGSAISGAGTSGTIPVFSGTNTIADSIITQVSTTVTIAGDLVLGSALTVANGGTGTGTFTSNGLLYGNGAGAVQVTAAGTGGQVLIANGSGVPTFTTFSGDVTVSNTGGTTIQANSVALSTDTTGDYVATLGSLTGLSTTGNTGEGSTPTLSVLYGSIASTAVQGNITLTCPSGTGNLSGGGTSITLGTGGTCGNLSTVNNPTFTTSVTTPTVVFTGAGSNGSIVVGNLGQGTIYTLPDPGGAAADICLSTGNCATAGTAGGDLTGTYPNPTIAKLQNTNLSITSPSAGHVLIYNGTNSAWENHTVSSDIAISETGVATIQSNAVALGTDTTGNYVIGLTAGNGVSVTGSAGEGWSPTVAVLYGSSANTAVEGNTSITVSAGTNLTGGGSITLGAGGSVTLNVASSPTFSGTLAVQGATATIGTSSQQGSVVLNDGAGETGTIQTAALGQATTFTLPDPGVGSATICLTTGNCAGSGSGVTTTGGTTNRLSKFTASQAIGDSLVSDDGSTVTVTGSGNFVVQGGTATLGALSTAGTLSISDGSSNTISIVAAATGTDRTYTLPDAGGPADFCLSTGNCIGGGGGGAPSSADYLVLSLNGSLSNERALTNGTNIAFTDAGANGNLTVATVNNPTFSTSVTTPTLQSSGALVISSGATTVAIDATTTIELQDSTNVTGSIDVSAALDVGTGNAFRVSSGGAITTATGIVSSGTIQFSGLNCTGNANGGALTANASGVISCTDDDGAAGTTITGTGTTGTIPVFSGTQVIADSIITQASTTITIAGDLVLGSALTVANGGTGTGSFTSNGLLYGNSTGAVQVTAAGTGGQVLIANGSGVPTFVSFSGDVNVSNTGVTTIQPNAVALSTDTTGDYVANIGTLTGLSTTGNTGEGSTPTLSVLYGSIANTAVQGNVTLTCPSGTGNLTGGGTGITLGTGGTCGNLSTVNNPTFSTSVTTPQVIVTGAGSNGTIVVGNLGQGTVYTLPDPGQAAVDICLATGNCATAGSAGGDLTGTYPNPTIAKLQNTNLTISSPSAGHVLIYNGTNSAWENHAVSSDIAISETGVATIQTNAVALGTDTTGNYVLGLTAGNGVSVTGSAGEGWSPTVAVLYGSSANTAVEGNTSITVSAGTNLSGGGSITLGTGGSVTLNVSNSPTFSGTLAVQGATVTVGTAAQQGSVVLNDGAGQTGTLQTATLGQATVYTLPDPGAGTATICLTSGNCAGTGTGVTTSGGTTNRLSKFTASQAIGDSLVSDNGSVVTVTGSGNFVVQGGTATLGTTAVAGTLSVSDGSSNTISIVAAATAVDRTYTLPDAGGPADFCLSSGNCIGGGGGGAPSSADYLVLSLNGSLSNERALTNGTNIAFTDAGANGSLTVATVNNPTFSTSVTTPTLQSSGALVISSGATTVAIDATTTIELQDSTNVTGSIDVSAALDVGTGNAFRVSSGGAITAATGIVSSGTIQFSGLNCVGNANGGALTANASGVISCTDDDGAAGGTITGSGSSGTVALFNGTNSITDSIITQASTTINIAGDLTLNTDLTVANGGTGASSFTSNGILYGNGSGVVQVTAAGTGGQVLIANGSGVPTFVSFSGDVAVSNTGVTTIQANSVALGTDTTGDYAANIGTLTGLSTTGNTGEGSTPTLSVLYGSGANTAVQGNTAITCTSGSGNLSGGGGSITLGTGGSCGALTTVNNPTFTTSVTTPLLVLTGAGSNGRISVASLGQITDYTLPDPGGATATICISTGNCATAGTAGGDLTGTYPNPTIAKLQGTTVTTSSVASGNFLQYNGSAWVNQSLSGDVTANSSGLVTIATGAVTSGKIFDGTIANVDLAAGSFTNITGVGTLTGLTVNGATSINVAGSSNTSIGNSTGTFQLESSALDISTGGALTGVTGITTSGGYSQSGATANSLSGATSFTAAGTALSVSNNASIGGTLTVNTITPNSALTVGALGQSFTLQGNAGSTIKSDNGTFATTIGFVNPTATNTINFPALSAGGPYTVCTSAGNCGGVGATLQTAYDNSSNPEIVVDGTRGALTVRDSSGGIGANLLEVQNNTASTTYFAVSATGIATTGSTTSSGNINTTGGKLQTASTDRIDGSGNLVNIGNLTATGAITISSTGGVNTINLNAAGTIELQDATNVTGALSVSGITTIGTLGTTNTATLLCRNASNQIAGCNTTGAGAAFVQGGNNFGATATLGTTGANDLVLMRNNATIVTIGSGGAALASGMDITLIGPGAYISNPQNQTQAEVFGNLAVASDQDTVAVGYTALAQHARGIGIGSLANSNADDGIALGYNTSVYANGGIAIGSNASAGFGGLAIGSGATAGTSGTPYNNSIAINDVATASNQLVIGGGITQAVIGNGVTNATPTGFTLQATSGAGTDVQGADITIASGQSTGSGVGGDIRLAISAPLSSGSGLNSLTQVMGISGGTGAAIFQNAVDSTVAFQIQNAGSTPLFTVDTTNSKLAVGGDLVASSTATGTTGTTSGTGTNSTTVTLVAAGSFANNDVIFIDNAGQDFYTRIVSGGGTTTLTVSPAVTFETARTVTKYTVQNLGATVSDYVTPSNRFFQGYFTGGIVTGSGSTIYADQNITSTGRLEVTTAAGSGISGFKVQTAMTGASGLQVGNILGVTINPGGSSSAAHFGNESIVSIGTAGTTFTGDIIANLGQVNWSGASNTSSTGRLMGTIGKVVTASGAGSVQNAVALFGQLQYAVGTTVTNSFNVVASDLQSGTTTNLYGFYAENMTGGTNNFPLYLASATGGQPLLSVNGTGATTLRNSTNSTSAFQVLNSSAAALLTVDTTSNNRVTIGTSDTTGALLALDVKTDAGDPTGVNGGMYYNSSSNQFRCYQNSAWANCISSSAKEYLRAHMQTNQTANFAANDHLKFETVNASSGNSITLDTATTYTNGGGASIGRFTLVAGKTYKLSGSLQYASWTGCCSVNATFRWYDVTNTNQFGSAGVIFPGTFDQTNGQNPNAEGIITPVVNITVEMRITNVAGTLSQIGNSSSFVYPNAYIEVISDGSQIGQFGGASAGAAGTNGFVPGAAAGQQGSVLLGDATWSTGVTFLSGAATFQNASDSTTAFRVLRSTGSSSTPLFVIDSTNSYIYVGNPTADSAAALLVLDTKNSAGDPTGVAGAMYYNSSSNLFRCYQNGEWVNCIGMNPSTARKLPFYSNDFAEGTVITQFGFWTGLAASGASGSGRLLGGSGTPNHPGVVTMASENATTNTNTGYRLVTSGNLMYLGGGETFEAVINPATLTNVTTRLGFHDTGSSAAPTDGAWIEISGTTLSGKTSAAASSSTTGTTYTVSTSTWYRVRVAVNSGATSVTYTVYNDSGTALWTDSLSTNLPTGSGNLFGCNVVSTLSTATIANLTDVDYMAFWIDGARPLTR